jgi:hypothetical protein
MRWKLPAFIRWSLLTLAFRFELLCLLQLGGEEANPIPRFYRILETGALNCGLTQERHGS